VTDMDASDAQAIIALAALAAAADGNQSDAERANIAAAAARLGLPADDARLKSGPAGGSTIASLVASLSGDEARLAAYDVAAAVCQVDGVPNAAESAFLTELSRALGAVPGLADSQSTLGEAATAPSGARAPAGNLSTFILDQAMREPHHAPDAKPGAQRLLDLATREQGVAVRVEQALLGGEQRARAVDRDGTSLQHEHGRVVPIEAEMAGHALSEAGVLVVGQELLPPGVEVEVDCPPLASRADDDDGSHISGP